MSIVLPCTENVVDDEDTRDETFLVTNLTTKMSTFQRQGVTMPVPCINGVTMTVPGMNGATLPVMVGV
jgi:hypothetical protein